MKSTINLLLIIASTATLSVLPAHASSLLDNVYVGASINSVSYDLGNSAQKSVDSLNDNGRGDYALNDSDVGYNAFAGYQFTPLFSVEVGYRKLGEFGVAADLSYQFLWEGEIVDVSGTSNELAELTTVEVLAKFTLPLNEQLSMYGKAGFINYSGDLVSETDLILKINRTNYSEDYFESETTKNDGTDKTFVLGFSYDLAGTEVFAEYQKFRLENESANSFNIGALYWF